MIIKKFQGKTEAEAIEHAKKELGDGIVIMNVRKLKKKGIFAIFRSQLTEVTVALEEEQERYSAVKKTATPVIKVPEVKPQETVQSEKSNTEAIEEKLDSLQSLLVQQIKKTEPAETEIQESVQEESVKEEQEEKKPSELDKFMRLLYRTMIENEVDEKYANQILEEVEKLNKPNMPFDYVLAGVYQKMILKFGQAEEIAPAGKGARVVVFLGPTGVGKTTTIAKLASLFTLDKKKKVALLTADTYRIAAAEQLRTYANILKVPFRIIYTKEELELAVMDFAEYDYIFIDTAGHSHQNKEQKENVGGIIEVIEKLAEKEIFLVLSATTKYRDLLEITNVYKEISNYKLIFTKLDETSAHGNLLNIKLHTQAPLSYVTYGQNVPDDIEVFNPQKTVKRLLGGKKDY